MSMGQARWDARFLDLARHVAQWSKDRSRKVGCVIVGADNEVRAMGYNGFPRGVNDDEPSRHERPAKYKWTEHAERNAIYNAAGAGVALRDCTAYVPWYPCMDCARALVQVGVARIVCGERPDLTDPKWGPEFVDVELLCAEAGVFLDVIVTLLDVVTEPLTVSHIRRVVFINGARKEIAGTFLTYDQIVELADTGRSEHVLHTIVVHYPAASHRAAAIIAPREATEVLDSMHIDCVVTDRA